jgi:hypothetical protein
MVFLEGYDRERAIADGLLIDVSETIGKALRVPCPVAVSAALWHHPEVQGDPGQLDDIVSAGAGFLSDFQAGESSRGEFSCSVVLSKGTYATAVSLRVIFEPCAKFDFVATIVEEGEVFDLRCPRVGSFYPV